MLIPVDVCQVQNNMKQKEYTTSLKNFFACFVLNTAKRAPLLFLGYNLIYLISSTIFQL